MKSSRNRKLNKRIYAGLAVLLVAVVGLSAIFALKNTAYAKETLLGIEHIRDKTMSSTGTPFTILEIVPDDGTAAYKDNTQTPPYLEGFQIKTPYDVDGSAYKEAGITKDRVITLGNEGGRSDATFLTGTAGYYIAGQEPIFKDWVNILSDKESSPSLLTDSYARAQLADKMRESVNYLITSDGSGVFYEDSIKGYHELRLGETIGKDVNGDGVVDTYATATLMDQLVASSKYYEIGHTYTGDKAYIDLAEGLMKKVASGKKGNYALTYLPTLTESEPKELDTTKDAAYLFTKNPDSPTTSLLFTKSERKGLYDPFLLYKEDPDQDEDAYRATFAYIKGAESGYTVTKSKLVDKEDNLEPGTPLYTYDKLSEVYLFAGFFDEKDAEGTVTLDSNMTEEQKALVDLAYPEITKAPTDDDAKIDYYTLEFQYAKTASATSKFYQVSYYDFGESGTSTSAGKGRQYLLNETVEGSLVQNANGTGLIDVKNTVSGVNENFIYDYAPQTGLFEWTSDKWLSGADAASKSLYRIRGAKIYFSAGIVNNDKFKKNVFDLDDSQCAKFPITVKTVSAKDVTTQDVNSAKLIILHNGSTFFSPAEGSLGEGDDKVDFTNLSYKQGERDISTDVLKAIVGRVVNEALPVVSQHNVRLEVGGNVIEPTALDSMTTLPTDTPNVYYLTRTLALDRMEDYYSNVLLSGSLSTPPMQFGSTISEGTVNGNANNVNKSVFNVTLSNDNPQLGFLNINFLNAVSDAAGYEKVLQNIQSENIYRIASGLSGRIEEKVSLATIIRYIIAYADSQNFGDKGSLHILEIAPCASYELKLETSKVGDKQKTTLYKILSKNALGEILSKEELISYEDADLTLTQMTTAEFIGHIEDINAHYDLVYISADIGPYKLDNGTLVRLEQNDQGKTIYNDSSMNGLIYTNVGDSFRSVSIGMYQQDEYVRFSGNDITQEKQRALESFIQAGFPIVVSDKLVELDSSAQKEEGKRTPLKVNTSAVDNSSYMYRLLQNIRERENFFRLSEVSAPLLNMYFSISRPIIHMDKDSLCYRAQSEPQRLQNYRDGYCRAIFEFAIESRGVGGSESDYDFELFIDINADGKFSRTTEKITAFVLEDFAGNRISRDDEGRYRLSPDNNYRVTYLVSSDQRGVLPWKFVVTKNDDAHLKRADAIGYYEIRDPNGILEKVHVLQIEPDPAGTKPTWNMEATIEDTNTQFSKLINNHEVVPFDVSIDTIPVNKLTVEETTNRLNAGTLCVKAKLEDSNKNGSLDREEYLDFFRYYDMIVIGYADWMNVPQGEALQAIKLYIDEGRSILFTHDTTSSYTLTNVDSRVPYNQLLRDTFGMDRYNVTGMKQVSEDDTFEVERPYKPKDHRESVLERADQGLTYSVIIRKSDGDKWENKGNQLFIQSPIRENRVGGTGYDWDGKYYWTTSVESVNKGQITMYPYVLDEGQFSVAGTHGQYWQLDFTKDLDKDQESDLVVWYTLSGRPLYDMSPRDVRNNYYIYNMRNVTYSGVGHSPVMDEYGNGSINEIKLFINTLIASYESGLHAPTVRIIENYKPNSKDVNSIYLSYDEQIKQLENATVSKGVIDDIENVYFVADTTSLVRDGGGRTHTFTANLYMEVPDMAGATILTYKGDAVYGKQLAIEGLYYLGADGNEVQVPMNADGSYPITPGVVYKARVPIAALRYYSNGTAVFDESETPVDPSDRASARNARNVIVTATEKIRMNASGIETEAMAIDTVAFIRVRLFDLD